MSKLKERNNREKIKESLLEQLGMMGASLDHYVDLINDYMGLWDVKTDLLADIKARGVTYQDFSSTGVAMWKNNPSVKELVGVNRQMLTILKELGLSTDKAGTSDEDEL